MRYLLLALVLLSSSGPFAEEKLRAASVRSGLTDSADGLAGNLYNVDLAKGVFELVGAIRLKDGRSIGVTGLADHPVSGVLYGITAATSPNHPRALVTIDENTAEATLVGPLGAAGSDIAFDRRGKLYVWLRQTSQLGTVDLATGRATPIGAPGRPGETGGLAIDNDDHAYLSATGATGTLDTIDLATGKVTLGPELRGAPYPAGINSLTLSPTGVLYAVNTNLGSPSNTLLVKIDPRTGTVTQLGPLPNDTDGIVFSEHSRGMLDVLMSRESLMAIAAVLALIIVAMLVWMPSRRGSS